MRSARRQRGCVIAYCELVQTAEAAGDPITEDLAAELLADEEAHRTEFRGFEKLGFE